MVKFGRNLTAVPAPSKRRDWANYHSVDSDSGSSRPERGSAKLPASWRLMGPIDCRMQAEFA